MVSLERALVLGALGLLGVPAFTRPALADEAPVERPAVDHPAMPQAQPEQPVERPATAHPAAAHPAAAQPAPAQRAPRTRSTRRETSSSAPERAAEPARHERHPGSLYLGAGLGVLTGFGGGADFERTNPAFTAIVGVELPIGRATGLGFELAGDLEISGSNDRGSYAAALLRVRLSQLLSPSTRLWGALGIGRAGYESGELAGALAAGTTFLFTRRFGLDLSANLNFVGASHDNVGNAGRANDYQGGTVLLLAAKALFEISKSR